MTIKTLNSNLKTSLENYDPFIVAHLVKFERPTTSSIQGGVANISSTSYSYFTDAQHDILFDDGEVDTGGTDLGIQKYRANKLQKLGTVNENIQAKASNMSLVVDSASIGTSATSILTFTTSEITGEIDLSSAGFQEGDKVLLLRNSGSFGNDNKHVRIESFKNGGKTIVYTAIDSIIATSIPQEYTISQASEEIVSILADKYSDSYTGYINREVLIYRAHINPETRAIIGEPYLYFKGITSGVSLDERLDASKITWTLSSHWGDFLRVQGRLTDDSTHRSLKLDGTPDLDSVVRTEYAGDLGFMHANTAVNQIASYMIEEEYLAVQPTSGHLNFQSTETVTKIRDVEKNVNLAFNPEAKMLPVVYGVRKVDSFPVFVDTHKDTSSEVYKLDAICEGKISGILDIHIDGIPTLCLDSSDFNTRNPSGTGYKQDEVEIECVGRADRGDTLAQYNASPASTQPAGQYGYGCTGYSPDLMGPSLSQAAGIPNGSDYFLGVTYEQLATGANNAQTQDATGLLHEGTHTILKPTPVDLTFHQGLENQRANDTLVSTAVAQNFKVQNDYYDPTRGAYWSPSHRLLDTAYVVGKYQIGEGSTTIPKLEYVVRGRDPESYNYDGSYKESSYYTSASHSSFALGSSVTLHETAGNAQIGDAVDIIDKWASFDSDGVRDYRFRFSTIPTLIDSNGDPITSFYMKNSSNNKWYMETWDITRETGSVHSTLKSSTFTVSDTASQYGLKATFSSIDSNFETALEDEDALIGVDTSNTATSLLASSWVYASYSNNVLDNLTNFETDPGLTHIYVKNAIKLDRSLDALFDNTFVGAKITVKSGGSSPYVQTRTIKKYDGATGIAFVDSPWDWAHIPSGADSYTIGSLGDKRVSLNPAIQLLDYMTNKRYGKGLDVEKDINIEDFKKAARECDTRSDVTMIFPSGSTFTKDDQWQYPASTSPLQWRGTVKEEPKTVNGKVEVTFTNVIGKIASKWNNYRSYATGEPYWYNDNLYMGAGSIVSNAPTGSGALNSFTIVKTGANSTTRNVDLSSSAANGNPIVKKHSSITGGFTASGYSLYDCDDVKYWKYVGWDDTSQRNVTRHQMNQVIDTTLPIFENINSMLLQFNGMLNYSAGKYSLHIKSKKGFVDNVEKISNEDIIGTIKLSDNGVKSSKNYVTTSILDPQSKFSARSVSFFNSKYLKEDKGIQKKATFSLPGITNYYNARFNIKQRLDESRFGLTIQFTMAPRGLLLNAGSIVEITYPRFGYSSKEFRITNLNLKKDGTVDVTASEHNDEAYEVTQGGTGASGSYGILETPESAQAPLSLPTISRPTSLTCTQNKQGEILLSWSNSGTFSSATHITEIYSSTVNDFENSTDPVSLIGTSSTNTFSDLVTEGQGNKTRYYWIRYQVKTNKLNLKGTDFRNVPSRFAPPAPENGTHVGVEGVGQAAFAVRTIKLSPGVTSAFVYNNAGNGIQFGNATSTTMSTTRGNVVGTESFKWYKDGVEIAGQTDSSFDYTAPSNVSDMPEIIKVELTDTLSDGTTITAEDEFTFIGLRTVEDAYTVIPSTPNYNFQATEFGTIDGPGSFSTTFTVKKGGTAYTYDGTSTYDANSYRYGTITNITPNGAVVINPNTHIDAATGAISISTSAGSFLTGTTVTQCSFDVTILDNADDSTIATSRIVLSKSLDGINARTVKLSAPEQVITYDSTGATPDPSAVFQITAEPFNTTGVPKYQFLVNGSSAQPSSTTATFDYTPPAAYSSLPQIITVKLREGSSQDVLATDTFTVFGVKSATDAVDQKTVFIFRLNDGEDEVGFEAGKSASDQNFADPLTGLEFGWSTGQQALDNNNDVIYMSQRTFTSDGSSPQQNAWEEPVIAARRIDGTSFTVVGSVPNAATANVRFRFEAAAYPNTEPSYNTPNVLIGSPTEQSYSVTIPSETVGSNTFTSLLMYVSPRDVPVHLGSFVLNASSDTASTLEPNFSEGFGGATITEVDNSPLGEYEHPSGGTTEEWGGFVNTESTLVDDAISFSSDGSITFNASIPNYTTQAQTILNASFNTQGSPASVGDAVIAQDTGNLWIWDGTSWDDVGQIKGDHGVDGINEKRVYLFAKNPTLDATTGLPPAITADAGQQTYAEPTSGVINGWTTTQGSLTAGDDIIYMVQRLFTSSGTGTETSWSAPIVISQRIDGVSPDALTITGTSKTSGVTTITFSDTTTVDVTDGTNAGVKVIYANSVGGSDGEPTDTSFDKDTREYVNYYEWTGSAPNTVPTGLTYTKFIGEDGDNEGVIPLYANSEGGSAGEPTDTSFDMESREFINFYEWTGSPPQAVPTGLTYVKFVGEDGAAGADPILLAYDNSSHVVPVSTSSTAVFTGSGGVLQVYEGTTELSLYQNTQTTDFPPEANPGTFSLDITKISGDTLTEPAISGASSVGATIADFTADPVTLTQVTKYKLTAYIRAAGGSTYTRSVDVSLVPADQGETGPDGLRTVTGYLYYEDTTGSAPAAPTGTTYHFTGDNTGLVTGTGINNSGTTNCWKNTPNTMQSSSTNAYYTVSYHGIEAASGQTTATVTYGTVRVHTSFSGVVTFSSGAFSQDGTAISDIDGTNVQLNSTALSEENTLNTNTTKEDVGLDQVTNDAQIKTDGTNAPDTLKNDQISINTDGTLTGAGSGQVTAGGIGAENLKLISSGGKTRTITGNKVAIEGDGTQNLWDTQVYSTDGYDAAQASWVVDNSTSYYAMIGINATPNTDITTLNTAEDYHHIDFAWYMRNQLLFAYKDGQNQSGDVEDGGEGTYAAGDKLSITYDGVNAKYYKNGSLLRTIAATKTGPFHFDSSWYLRNKSISQVQFGPITNAKDVLESDHTGPINGVSSTTVTSGAADGAQVQAQQSLLPRADDSEWTLGAVDNSGFVNGIWARNGSGGDENTIVFESGPFGNSTKVWKSISTDASSNDGGFHNNGIAQRFPIEDDVAYRFTVFVKQSDLDGSVYFGAYNYNDTPTNLDLFEYNGTSGTQNKYWFNGDLPSLGEWYLWVGFINPSNTSITSGKGGLYKVSTGVRVLADDDIRFNASATTFAIRTYLFYSTTGSGTTVRWAHPRIDRMDRSAPTIMQLLGSENAVLNSEISMNTDGTLNNAGSGGVTSEGIGADTLQLLSTNSVKPVTIKGNKIIAEYETVGSNLITNGEFTDGSTKWTFGSHWVWDTSGVMKRIDGTTNSQIAQDIDIVSGKYYRIRYDVVHTGGTTTSNIWSNFSGTGNASHSTHIYGSGSQDIVIQAGHTATIPLQLYGIGTWRGSFDNVIIEEVEDITDAWDTHVFSKDGYPAASVTFVSDQADSYIMAGLNTDPTTNTSYNTIDYAWFLKPGGVASVYESNNEVIIANNTYSSGDKFTITYDGINVKYFKNGTLKRTVAAALSTNLHFDSSFARPNKSISKVAFSPITDVQSIPKANVGLDQVTNDTQIKTDGSNAPNSLKNNQIQLNSDGTMTGAAAGSAVTSTGLGVDTLTVLTAANSGSNSKTITVVGNTIKAGTGTAGWNTHAYSKEGYEACALTYQVDSGTGSYFVGLNTDPTTNTSYSTIDYAIYHASGSIEIRKNGNTRYGPSGPTAGNAVYSWGSYSAGDTFAVAYDGVDFKFYHNGDLITSIENTTITSLLHMDTSFYSVNRQISKVSFKPITSIRTVPKSSVGLGNLNNPSTVITPISTADVSPNIGGIGQSQIDGDVIKAGSAVIAGEGTNKAGITGTAANGSIGTQANSAETDIRIFAGSEFDSRANAPFRVQQNGAFRAEFGHIGGFTVGSDSLISETASQPIITVGSNLSSNPSQQISLSSRDADEFLLYAGIEIPSDGVGLKKADNPPFGVDSNGKVFMREFELKDANNNVVLDSDNLLGPAINAQITDLLKAGADTVTYSDRSPNTGFKLVLTKAQNIQIKWRVNPGNFRVYGLDKDAGNGNGYTEANALNSICPRIRIKLERSTNGSTWTMVDYNNYYGVKQAGSEPALASNEYWIDAEQYQARSHGMSFRSEIRRGYGAMDEQGYFNETFQAMDHAAGTYYYRVNMNTSGTKGIELFSRTYDPTTASWYSEDETTDAGYGIINGTQTNFDIDRTRNFEVSTYSGSGAEGGSYSIDLNTNPPTVKEGKTFEDFLPLTGGNVFGNIGLYGGGYLKTPRIDGFGGSLILEAGESSSFSTGQAAERVYINAESGLEVSSHRNNWSAQSSTNTAAGWAGRKYARICDAYGQSQLPGKLSVTGDIQVFGGDNQIRLSKGGIKGYDGHTVTSTTSAPFFYVRTVKAANLTTPSQVIAGQLIHNSHLYSSGSIWHGANTFWRSADNTVMYTMYVKNHNTYDVTKSLKLHRVDDNIYAYVNGTLTDSQSWMSGRKEAVVDLDIVIPKKNAYTDAWKISRIDIIVNDAGGGTDALECFGTIIDHTNFPIEFQPMTSTYSPSNTSFSAENVNNN